MSASFTQQAVEFATEKVTKTYHQHFRAQTQPHLLLPPCVVAPDPPE